MTKSLHKQFSPAVNEQEDIEKKTFVLIVDKLYGHALSGSICGFLAATLLFYVLKSANANIHRLYVWYAAICVGYIFTIALYILYKKRQPDSSKIKYWFYFYGFSFIYFGFIWGCSTIFLIPPDVLSQSFLILFLFGVSGALIQATIGTAILGTASVLLLFMPLVYWCLTQSNTIILMMGYISIPFIGFLIFSQIVNTKIFKDSQRLRFELDVKNKELNQLNEHLEEKVEERTQELAYQATHDVMTGLPNRVMLEKIIEKAKRNQKKNFGLILISFKKLSSVNANFTHQVGDKLMKNIADYFQEQLEKLANENLLPEKHMLFRVRENVFALLLKSIEPENLENVIQLIMKHCHKTYDMDTITFDMPISLGASLYDMDSINDEELISNAEIALDEAKKTGNYNYKIYNTPLRQKSNRNLQIANDMQPSLNKNEFYLNYQPLYCIQTNKIIGCEALVRWNHPKLKLFPDEFIYIAEETGLIHALGSWVLEEACRQAKVWHDDGHHIKISVNVSPKQFEGDFLTSVKDALNRTGFNPHYLQFEITENENVFKDNEKKTLAIKTIQQLKELGIQFAMDDFGVGYSNISYLRQLGVTNIKIDKSIVNPFDEHNQLIIKTIVVMAHSLGLIVTCEGIETYEILEFLKEHTCDIGQGFLEILGKPISGEQFTELLKTKEIV